MHYQTELLKGVKLAPVDQFLKEMGIKEVAPVEVLKVTNGALPSETQVVVMEITARGSASSGGEAE
jgi:superfamily II helicase